MSEEAYGWMLIGIICLVFVIGCYVWKQVYNDWFEKEEAE